MVPSKQISCLLFSLTIFMQHAAPTYNSAVTYTFNGGRLGDKLISYLHAKWVSYVYGIPLLYKPFTYSDQLELHNKEIAYESYNLRRFSNYFELHQNQSLVVNPNANTLYIIPYFSESVEERQLPQPGINANNLVPNLGSLRNELPYFEVNWNDREFLHEIRQMIKPINNLKLIEPPQDGKISVAVHVRKNSGGFDLPLLHDLPAEQYNPHQLYTDVIFPFKHAPDEYFIEQIENIYHLYQQPLYIFIFTDDPNPIDILKKYRNKINNPEISFKCRNTEINNHYSNVLEDLFSMTKFNCFIRADSNISIVASKLTDFDILISPAHHIWQGRKLIIDKVNLTIKPELINQFGSEKINSIFHPN